MSIIFTAGRFWIEEINVPTATIAAGSASSTTFQLERNGVYLASGANIDLNATAAVAVELGMSVINGVTSGHLTIGDEITAIRARRWNNAGTGAAIGGNIIIFLRSKGQ